MAKLTVKVVGLSICTLVLVLGYLNFDSRMSKESQSTNSLFGRNVYEQNTSLGKTADPNYEITFPKDHASHDQFDIEWWYLTANLEDEFGDPYGLQWTLFRFRNPNSVDMQATEWHNNQIFMAHASIHSLNAHWFSEKFARGGVGNAGVDKKPFKLFIDNWQWFNTNDAEGLFPATLMFDLSDTRNENSQVKAMFSLNRTGPFVQHGDDGFSVKSASRHASHYYSAPFISIEGELLTSNHSNATQSISLSGQAWFDQEWTSQLLDTSTEGWDWLSLHLDNGSKIMAFRMRLNDQDDFITGSYIDNAGEQTTLKPSDLGLKPASTTTVKSMQLPLTWNLTIPSKKVDITVTTIKDDQWNNASIPYYEGMVIVDGSHKGKGFLELTGY